jgi:hypothetical protein
MYVYNDPRMQDLQARFRAICGMVDAEMEPVRKFAPDHRSEVYKAILKCLAIGDAPLVDLGLPLAREKFPGGDFQVYPMLHLPYDTNERGTWHRDHNSDERRVFWIPLTLYKYPALSVVPWTSGVLSFPASAAASRFINLDPVAQKLNVVEKTYYAWSSRMVHRGNLNTSDELSSALVIAIDRDVEPQKRSLPTLTPELVRERVAAIKSGVHFTSDGMIDKVDRACLDSLDQPFRDDFYGFFKLRTKLDLSQWQAT